MRLSPKEFFDIMQSTYNNTESYVVADMKIIKEIKFPKVENFINNDMPIFISFHDSYALTRITSLMNFDYNNNDTLCNLSIKDNNNNSIITIGSLKGSLMSGNLKENSHDDESIHITVALNVSETVIDAHSYFFNDENELNLLPIENLFCCEDNYNDYEVALEAFYWMTDRFYSKKTEDFKKDALHSEQSFDAFIHMNDIVNVTGKHIKSKYDTMSSSDKLTCLNFATSIFEFFHGDVNPSMQIKDVPKNKIMNMLQNLNVVYKDVIDYNKRDYISNFFSSMANYNCDCMFKYVEEFSQDMSKEDVYGIMIDAVNSSSLCSKSYKTKVLNQTLKEMDVTESNKTKVIASTCLRM